MTLPPASAWNAVLASVQPHLQAAQAWLERCAQAGPGSEAWSALQQRCEPLGQGLQAAAAELEAAGCYAAAQTVRALAAALQHLDPEAPARAPDAPAAAEGAQQLQRACAALSDYLQRRLEAQALPDAALFPSYRTCRQMLRAARAHPSDLWLCEARTVVPPPGPALQPQAALRERLEQGVLAWVRQSDAAAAAALVPLAAGLARAAPTPAACQYWLAAAACLELLAQRRLSSDNYLKRALAGLLTQYAALQAPASAQTQAQTALQTHELLYLIAHTPAQANEPVHVHAHRLAYAWPPLPAPVAPQSAPGGPGGAVGPEGAAPATAVAAARLPVLRQTLQLPPLLEQKVELVGPQRVAREPYPAREAQAQAQAGPQALQGGVPDLSAEPAPTPAPTPAPAPAPAPTPAPAPDPPRLALQLVPVGAASLEHWAGQAADLTAGQNRLEDDLQHLRRALGDMGAKLLLLRRQLRALELHQEQQAARLVPHPAHTLAPWAAQELERFAHTQSLMAQLAETVADVAALQHQMQAALQAAEGNLAAQSHHSHELERTLWRSRWQNLDASAFALPDALGRGQTGTAPGPGASSP